MKLLADECCDGRLAAKVHAAGYDIVGVPASRGISDRDVVRMAEGEGRVLLTNDLGFRRLAQLEGRPTSGAIILRFRPERWLATADRLIQLLEREEDKLDGAFWLVTPDSATALLRRSTAP